MSEQGFLEERNHLLIPFAYYKLARQQEDYFWRLRNCLVLGRQFCKSRLVTVLDGISQAIPPWIGIG